MTNLTDTIFHLEFIPVSVLLTSRLLSRRNQQVYNEGPQRRKLIKMKGLLREWADFSVWVHSQWVRGEIQIETWVRTLAIQIRVLKFWPNGRPRKGWWAAVDGDSRWNCPRPSPTSTWANSISPSREWTLGGRSTLRSGLTTKDFSKSAKLKGTCLWGSNPEEADRLRMRRGTWGSCFPSRITNRIT